MDEYFSEACTVSHATEARRQSRQSLPSNTLTVPNRTALAKPKAQAGKFYLIMHEHLFVFRKPAAGEDLSRIRYSGAIYDL